MACFDLQHQYRVQPLFCWQFTGCTARSCYTGSGALITACTTARPPGAFLESPPPPPLWTSGAHSTPWPPPPQGTSVLQGCFFFFFFFLPIAEACLEIGWRGRLSVHDSSLFLCIWSFLVVTPHTAIGTLIPCTIQKFLSPLRMCYCTLGSFPGTSSGFLRIDAFPVKGAQIHICSFFFFFFSLTQPMQTQRSQAEHQQKCRVC